MPAGRPTSYRPEYCEQVIEFCARGFSLTGFAGEIGVCRDTIAEWMAVHPKFSEAAKRAKAARAMWWEQQAINVAGKGGQSGQSTLIIFGLKNHAAEDYREVSEHLHGGKEGAPPIAIDVRAQALKALDEAFVAAEIGGKPDSDNDLDYTNSDHQSGARDGADVPAQSARGLGKRAPRGTFDRTAYQRELMRKRRAAARGKD